MDEYDVNRVKPDSIIFLKVPVHKAKSRIKEGSKSEIDLLGPHTATSLTIRRRLVKDFWKIQISPIR